MRTFIYRLLFLSIFLCLVFPFTFGQNVEENQEVRTFLNNMFQNLDKTKIPNGLLRDYAFELVELDKFSGAQTVDNNFVDRQTYEMLLRSIRSSAVGTKPFGEVFDILAKQYSKGSNNTISLSAMAYQYSAIKANALKDGLIRYENEKVYDNIKNGVWQNPYESKYAIGFCAHDSIFTGSSFTFKLERDCWFSNLSYQSIELNVGDGQYRPITLGGNITVSLSSGIKDIKLRVKLTNGTLLNTHSSIRIKSQTATTRNYTTRTFIRGKAYRGINTAAEVFVRMRNNNFSITKPLIVVEGFDPRSKEHPLGATNHYNFTYLVDSLGFQIGNSKLSTDYDIIYVDWVNSEEYIQANSNTLKEIILWVNQQKRYSGSTAPNVILGQSMGGLVARYTLRTMENENTPHQTSFYVSHDAPHLGANVPLGVLYSLHGIMSFFENKTIIGHFFNKPDSTGTLLQQAENLVHCHAARQMLVNYIDFAGNLNNSDHIEWQQELVQLGFPQGDKTTEFRMLCIANGSYLPNAVSNPYLDIDFSASSDIANLTPTIGALSSIAIGVLLQDLWAGLLNFLPGKSTIKGLATISPGTATGKNITNLKLKYIKKLSWLVNISRTVFSYQRNMPGGLCYDNFPASKFLIKRETSKDGGIPVIGYFDYNVKYMSDHIPFMPTSSALCAGGGSQALSTSLFMTQPNITNTPFGANTFIDNFFSTPHINLNASVLEWLVAQLDLGIVGPKLGVTGSKYIILNHESESVQWASSAPSIASINSNGILTVTGKGVVIITANVNGRPVSKQIIVGTPRFVLENVKREPGFYCIKAQCIDTESGYADFIKGNKDVITYEWGVKTNDETLKWIKSDSPELHLSTLEQKDNTTIYLKTIDMYGNESTPSYVRISGYDIWELAYNTLIFNQKGEIYNEKGIKLYYDHTTLPLTFKEGSYGEFTNAKWSPVAAMIVTDETTKGFIWNRYGYIKDLISPLDKERIMGMPNGTVMIYKLVLLNFAREVIQRSPLTIMYKENFPN